MSELSGEELERQVAMWMVSSSGEPLSPQATFHVITQLVTASARVAELEALATEVLAKWDEATPKINGAITMATIHGAPYTGPNCGPAFDALRAALTPRGGGGRMSHYTNDDPAPQFRLSEDGSHVEWFHVCDALYRVGAVEREWVTLPNGPGTGGEKSWRIVQREPLTVTPSINCYRCGTHGIIRDGQWFNANGNRDADSIDIRDVRPAAPTLPEGGAGK